MVEHVCKKCQKSFKQKGHYTAHMNRKTPCISESKLREILEKEIQSKSIQTYNVVDLFSGAGGLTHGFVQAGFNVLFGVEHDEHAVKTYSANFEHPMLHADIIIGGPPCQGFSMAGKRDNKDPRNSLFMDYLRFVNAFQPKYFVLENVPGILTMKNAGGELVKDIIASEVSKLGYSLKYEKMYAPDYGVPQKRRRVVFLGWKPDISEPSFPSPTHTSETYVCMKDVLIPKNEVPLKYYHSQKMITGFMERLKKNKENGKGFGAQFINENQPCYTISARYYKDGCDALVKYSDTEIRKLTEKEAARVQTFPDSFVFPVSSVQTYKQIGNAVPCLLGYVIAKSILNSLNL